MKWPWVSARAYDVVVEDRDRLRIRVASLEDALTRLNRWERGMTESPRPERKPLLPMPLELKEHYDRHADKRIARVRAGTAYKRHAQGEPWQTIMDSVLNAAEDDEEEDDRPE